MKHHNNHGRSKSHHSTPIRTRVPTPSVTPNIIHIDNKPNRDKYGCEVYHGNKGGGGESSKLQRGMSITKVSITIQRVIEHAKRIIFSRYDRPSFREYERSYQPIREYRKGKKFCTYSHTIKSRRYYKTHTGYIHT